jgi:hypothetical protein
VLCISLITILYAYVNEKGALVFRVSDTSHYYCDDIRRKTEREKVELYKNFDWGIERATIEVMEMFNYMDLLENFSKNVVTEEHVLTTNLGDGKIKGYIEDRRTAAQATAEAEESDGNDSDYNE